jgi:predicted protein tyrosine phosphatase
MSTEVTITLTDEAYQQVERFARLANRDVASVLAETIYASIPYVGEDVAELEPVADLPDEQVLALTQLQMEPEQDAELSRLLDRQQAGLLTQVRTVIPAIPDANLSRRFTPQSDSPERSC